MKANIEPVIKFPDDAKKRLRCASRWGLSHAIQAKRKENIYDVELGKRTMMMLKEDVEGKLPKEEKVLEMTFLVARESDSIEK